AQAGEIVVDRALDRRIEILADVDAENAASLREARASNVRDQTLDAVVVEAHPVDQCLRFRQAKQAWPGIARLRPRRHRADLDETESQRSESIDVFVVLVQSHGYADCVGEVET